MDSTWLMFHKYRKIRIKSSHPFVTIKSLKKIIFLSYEYAVRKSFICAAGKYNHHFHYLLENFEN